MQGGPLTGGRLIGLLALADRTEQGPDLVILCLVGVAWQLAAQNSNFSWCLGSFAIFNFPPRIDKSKTPTRYQLPGTTTYEYYCVIFWRYNTHGSEWKIKITDFSTFKV